MGTSQTGSNHRNSEGSIPAEGGTTLRLLSAAAHPFPILLVGDAAGARKLVEPGFREG
jgi:hypothetical protein